MTDLSPLNTLLDTQTGDEIPLPETLLRLYGSLRFPAPSGKSYIISNFVSTIDGVVTLGVPGKLGGDAISGKNRHDGAVMGILRAISDAVILGSGNLAASPKHIWIPERVARDLAGEYAELRRTMGKPENPLNVLVTARGHVDLSLPIFQSGKVNVLIVTTTEGAKNFDQSALPRHVSIAAPGSGAQLSASQIIDAISHHSNATCIFLVEGGPHLMGTFLADDVLDELFLTLAPQIAGRTDTPERPGIVAGKLLAPDHPAWGNLVSLKQAGSHLFLRYRFRS